MIGLLFGKMGLGNFSRPLRLYSQGRIFISRAGMGTRAVQQFCLHQLMELFTAFWNVDGYAMLDVPHGLTVYTAVVNKNAALVWC